MIDLQQVSGNIMLKNAYVSFASHNPKWKFDSINELYNYIYHRTDKSQYNLLELEIKLGTFKFAGVFQAFNYIQDIFKLPAVINNDVNNINFESRIGENDFYALLYYMDCESEKNPEIKKLDPEVYYEILHSSGKRKSDIINLRTQEKRRLVIIKDEKHHVQLRNNGTDFRITIAKEFPTEITEMDKPNQYRDKFRMSYKFRFFRLDLTIVVSGKTQQEKDSSCNIYEVEFEFDEINYRAKEFVNFESFYKIIERYLDNAFTFYELISNEYYAKFYNQNKTSESSYGDYLEKNGYNKM